MNAYTAAIIAAGVGLLSAAFVALVNRTPYAALAERIVKLEESDETKARKISDLEAEVARLRAEVAKGHTVKARLRARIEHLQTWIATHASHVTPQPDPVPLDLLEE